jgi:uncharacterized protein YjfI (DUF2170 family)
MAKEPNPSSKKAPLSQGERSERRRDRLKALGLKRVEVWVAPKDEPLVQFVADRIRNGSVITASPAATTPRSDDPLKKSEIAEMTTVSTPWTAQTLKTAIESCEDLLPGEFACEVLGENALEVTVEAAGDLKLYVGVTGEQIVTSTLLWARDEQENPKGFEATMLRNHKELLPLCALGIKEINGREYYELFGSMSSRSVLASVITEFRTIANNAIEMAKDLHPSNQLAA